MRFGYSGFDARRLEVKWIEAQPGDLAPPPLTDPETALVAMDDLPLPAILANRGGRLYYWPNDGRGWGPARVLAGTPFAGSFEAEGVQLVDMDGTGSADMLVGANPLNGYYENRSRCVILRRRIRSSAPPSVKPDAGRLTAGFIRECCETRRFDLITFGPPHQEAV